MKCTLSCAFGLAVTFSSYFFFCAVIDSELEDYSSFFFFFLLSVCALCRLNRAVIGSEKLHYVKAVCVEMVGVCVVLFFSSFLDMRCFFFLFCLRSTVAERMGSLLCVCVCVCVCVFCQKGAHRSLKRKGRKPLKKKKRGNPKEQHVSFTLLFFFF